MALEMLRCVFFFQAEDGIRDAQESRGLGDVYKRQGKSCAFALVCETSKTYPCAKYVLLFFTSRSPSIILIFSSAVVLSTDFISPCSFLNLSLLTWGTNIFIPFSPLLTRKPLSLKKAYEPTPTAPLN